MSSQLWHLKQRSASARLRAACCVISSHCLIVWRDPAKLDKTFHSHCTEPKQHGSCLVGGVWESVWINRGRLPWAASNNANKMLSSSIRQTIVCRNIRSWALSFLEGWTMKRNRYKWFHYGNLESSDMQYRSRSGTPMTKSTRKRTSTNPCFSSMASWGLLESVCPTKVSCRI